MSKGIDRERKVRALLDDDGWWTARAAGSFGDADIIALRATDIGLEAVLVEVKATARGPFAGFGPDQRADLIAAAVKSGATPLLCWWPPRKPPQWIRVEDWPAAVEPEQAA